MANGAVPTDKSTTAALDPFLPLVARLIGVEGGYTNDPKDAGGETMWGITAAVARAAGYNGSMSLMPRGTAVEIYRLRYWTQPSFSTIYNVQFCGNIALKMFDIGVNMGQHMAGIYLQRALNALNNNGVDYDDLAVDGALGFISIAALRLFIGKRGKDGAAILLFMIGALQSVHYVELAESKPTQERFEYGWQAQRALYLEVAAA